MKAFLTHHAQPGKLQGFDIGTPRGPYRHIHHDSTEHWLEWMLEQPGSVRPLPKDHLKPHRTRAVRTSAVPYVRGKEIAGVRGGIRRE